MRLLHVWRPTIAFTAAHLMATGLSTSVYACENPTATTQAAGKARDGLQLTARVQRERVAQGEPVWLSVSLRNRRDRSIQLIDSNFPSGDYQYLITDSRGEVSPLTRFGRQQKGVFINRSHRVRFLGDGMEATSRVPISLLYDMSLPGKYLLTITRTFDRQDGKGSIRVISNTVTVEVEWTSSDQ